VDGDRTWQSCHCALTAKRNIHRLPRLPYPPRCLGGSLVEPSVGVGRDVAWSRALAFPWKSWACDLVDKKQFGPDFPNIGIMRRFCVQVEACCANTPVLVEVAEHITEQVNSVDGFQKTRGPTGRNMAIALMRVAITWRARTGKAFGNAAISCHVDARGVLARWDSRWQSPAKELTQCADRLPFACRPSLGCRSIDNLDGSRTENRRACDLENGGMGKWRIAVLGWENRKYKNYKRDGNAHGNTRGINFCCPSRRCSYDAFLRARDGLRLVEERSRSTMLTKSSGDALGTPRLGIAQACKGPRALTRGSVGPGRSLEPQLKHQLMLLAASKLQVASHSKLDLPKKNPDNHEATSFLI